MWRRRIGLKVTIVTFVALMVALALGGLAAVDDGVDRFAGAARAAAQDAVLQATFACGNEPGERILRRKWRVIALKTVGTQTVASFGGQRAPDYRARVRSYTLFGLPTGTITVRPTGNIVCGGGPG